MNKLSGNDGLLGFTSFNGLEPKRQQLIRWLKHAIYTGQLKAGTKLMSSRRFAADVGASRNTVTDVYDQLIAEGYLYSQRGVGCFVVQIEVPNPSLKARKLRIADRLQDIEAESNEGALLATGGLLAGLADPHNFPHKTWNQLQKQHYNNIDDALLLMDEHAGLFLLREAISSHIAISRGVVAQPSQIFITSGASQSISMIASVLSNPGDVAWVEEPGYGVAAGSLQLAGLELGLCPIDSSGLIPNPKFSANFKNNPNSSNSNPSNPTLIYTTASFQYPLGHTMPVARRLELLSLAKEKDAWVVEDDYDGEFRYKGEPVPSIFSIDENHRTLYMGTFSKSLSPNLRMSYIVVPKDLTAYFRKIYPCYGNVSSIVNQASLAEFISRGHFSRHIKKMRNIYGERKSFMERQLSDRGLIDTSRRGNNPAGLHLIVRTEGQEEELASALKSERMGILMLSECFQEPKNAESGVLLGFTAGDIDELTQSLGMFDRLVKRNNIRTF